MKPLFRRFTDGRRDDDRGIGREGGARRTGLKSPSLLSLDRSLTISSTSPTSAASCSGLRFGEGVRGRVSGARAGRSRMSFARREHSTRRRWKSGDPGGIGPSRAYREARALTRHRHRRRRRSRTSCETLGARQGSPRRNAPSLFVGNREDFFRRQRRDGRYPKRSARSLAGNRGNCYIFLLFHDCGKTKKTIVVWAFRT